LLFASSFFTIVVYLGYYITHLDFPHSFSKYSAWNEIE
jgi:hypothetical protein